MANIKFSQLPNLPLGNIDPTTYTPVVDAFTNYTMTMANLTTYVNQNSGNISVTGTISATGNITGSYILGNGSQLTGLPATYGNANVVANLAALGSNPVSTTGNITAGYFVGNGSALTGIVTSTYGNANVAANLAAFGSNPISTTGNITAGYFVGNGSQLTGIATSSYGNANVAANLAAFGSNPVSTTGNITAGYFVGNGSALTGITSSYGNANVVSLLSNFGSNSISTTGNISTATVSATGNISANYYIGNGSQLTGIAGGGSNANVTTRITSSFAVGTYSTGTGEIISATATIPANTFVAGDVVEIVAEWLTNAGSVYQRYLKAYINTTNAIPSASLQVGGWIGSASQLDFSRTLTRLDVVATSGNTRGFYGGGSASAIAFNNASGLGENSTGAGPLVFNIDWTTTQYVIFTCARVAGAGSEGAASAGYQIYRR